MKLFAEIIAKAIENEETRIVFPNLQINAAEIVETRCYKALAKIKAIIEDDSLTDAECFLRIEEIVRVFEELGSSGGTRHDFG